jgi:hypothetical protein
VIGGFSEGKGSRKYFQRVAENIERLRTFLQEQEIFRFFLRGTPNT